MAKFMFLYRGGEEAESQMSPEEMQQVLGSWMEWIGAACQAGWMIQPGDGLLPTGAVVRADGSVTDGPFAESKELVGGYSVVEAADVQAAAALTKGCPIFQVGGAVEVREVAVYDMPEGGA